MFDSYVDFTEVTEKLFIIYVLVDGEMNVSCESDLLKRINHYVWCLIDGEGFREGWTCSSSAFKISRTKPVLCAVDANVSTQKV